MAKRKTPASNSGSHRSAATTDWARLTHQTDRQIERAVVSDTDAPPIADESWFRRARLLEPQPKQAVSIRLDEDLIQWFKSRGKGYQTRINAVLRAYVEAHR